MLNFISCTWDRFLFVRIDIKQYAFLRIGIGFLITLYLINLLPYYSVHYSFNAWLSPMGDLDLYHSGSWSILFWLQSQTQSWYFLYSAIACSMLYTLGAATKISGCCTLIALISLWNKNPLLLDGDDAILRVMLFFLLFSPSGRVLSIDAFFRLQTRHSPVWPLRMMQIQFAFVYFVSGWVKFHSPEWLDGSVLQTVLIHPEYSRFNLSAWMSYEWLVKLLGVISGLIMWWELLFPLLCLQRHARFICVIFGIIFHLGLLLMMNLREFSIIMLVLYMVFIPNRYFCSNRSSSSQN